MRHNWSFILLLLWFSLSFIFYCSRKHEKQCRQNFAVVISFMAVPWRQKLNAVINSEDCEPEFFDTVGQRDEGKFQWWFPDIENSRFCWQVISGDITIFCWSDQGQISSKTLFCFQLWCKPGHLVRTIGRGILQS